MRKTSNKEGSSFFKLCRECDGEKLESEMPSTQKFYTPMSKKYTHAMISPKASLADLQRQKMKKFEAMKSPNAKLTQSIKPTLTQQFRPSSSKGEFKGFFKKESRVDHLKISAPLNPQYARENQDFNVQLLGQPAPLKHNFSQRQQTSTKVGIQNPKHSIQIGSYPQTPHKVHNLDKTTHPTQASSRHGINSDPRVSGSDRRPYSNYPFLDLQLGNSRFTVMSESEEESPKSIKMEQSVVLVNVFNPTDSQISKWAQNKRKLSSLNASNLTQKAVTNSKRAKFVNSLSQIITDL